MKTYFYFEFFFIQIRLLKFGLVNVVALSNYQVLTRAIQLICLLLALAMRAVCLNQQEN